jgi:hypothetical protein
MCGAGEGSAGSAFLARQGRWAAVLVITVHAYSEDPVERPLRVR